MTGPEYSDFDRRDGAFRGQRKADLPPAGELDVDLRQQLGVEQRAVPDAVTAVDPVTRAQGVERVLGARVPPARLPAISCFTSTRA